MGPIMAIVGGHYKTKARSKMPPSGWGTEWVNGGEGGIRTLGPPQGGQRFSRPPRSTAPAPLRLSGGKDLARHRAEHQENQNGHWHRIGMGPLGLAVAKGTSRLAPEPIAASIACVAAAYLFENLWAWTVNVIAGDPCPGRRLTVPASSRGASQASPSRRPRQPYCRRARYLIGPDARDHLPIMHRNIGVPGRTRTCDPQFRKLLLYPPELRGPSRTT
jgi:hypothetical protein